MNNFNNTVYPGGMYNNTIGNYGPSGYMQQPVTNPKTQNVLTPEEIKSLRKNVDKFTLALSQDEALRGVCFHRDENGFETLQENGDGTYTCSVCGYKFDPKQNCTEDKLQEYVKDIIDVLQTIKLLYSDMTPDMAREYFTIIPLIEKVPRLFKIASDNFARHENYNSYRYNGAPNTISLYHMLNNGSLNNMYQQPMMGQGYVNVPPMGQQPVQNQYPQSNGFGYGMATPPVGTPAGTPGGYQPTTTGFGYVPNQTNINNQPTGTLPQNNVAYAPQAPLASPTVQQPIAPVTAPVADAGAIAPTNVTATTDGKEVKVNTTFKS